MSTTYAKRPGDRLDYGVTLQFTGDDSIVSVSAVADAGITVEGGAFAPGVSESDPLTAIVWLSGGTAATNYTVTLTITTTKGRIVVYPFTVKVI